MAEVWIRLLTKDGARVEDGQHDISLADFAGNVPAVGDRIVTMPDKRAVRVVERLFEADGGKEPYINLIVELADMSDVDHLPRFSRDRQ